jgi:hypothetical protein
MQSRSIYRGDGADRLAHLVYVLAHNLNERPAPGTPTSPPVEFRARMSLGGLFFDAVEQVRKQIRSGKVRLWPPQPDPVQAARMRESSSNSPAGTPNTDAGSVSTLASTTSVATISEIPQQAREWTILPGLDGAPLDNGDWMQGLDPTTCEEIVSLGSFGSGLDAGWDLQMFLDGVTSNIGAGFANASGTGMYSDVPAP